MSDERSAPTVFLVDDDPAVRESLQWLLESEGLRVEVYASGREFLDRYDPDRPGCLLLDVRMPGLSGLEIQERLAAEPISVPVIIITGHGDVPLAVRAIKAGAVDVIEKPLSHEVLMARIKAALARDAETRREYAQRRAIEERISRLTPREREIMDLLVKGDSSKEIALRLGLSPKTVETHRVHILEKMQADSHVRLVQMVLSSRTKP
ncbi:MAG TPA: response regulator [Phycisphaerae bacterium]|nr:response regulator [Phycisphaerae bacterium]